MDVEFIIRQDQIDEINELLKRHSILAVRNLLKQLPMITKEKKEEN